MGNSSTKEQRSPTSPVIADYPHIRHQDPISGQSSAPHDRPAVAYSSRASRGSRNDLPFINIGSSSNNVDAPEVRRETKQEREARKLARERELRGKERERSMKEEHIDGGFCVTQGVYNGTEDFSKPVVRQLMIERRIAPFWRGLNDFKEEWTEHQLVAAARGLPIPAADEIPPQETDRLMPLDSPRSSSQNLPHLTVPISSRSQSYASDTSANLTPGHPAFSLPPPSSPLSTNTPLLQPSSPFRPRSKTLASLTTSNKIPYPGEMVPQEIQLPPDPYVNGQAVEAFLYKDAVECPICFVYYPPYLNRSRCCDQSICSECFVQIKRPDPHPPEHEQNDPLNPTPPAAQTDPESLVSEPATCPYCQQPEFGVTYEPPSFRRGLAYPNMGNHRSALGNATSAMSSSSSLSSTGPSLALPATQRRRSNSLPPGAPTVITTDRIRPDWAVKLANARNHAARRSAAATALHTAAYLMGNGVADNRGFAFSGRSRFGRNRGESPGSGSATPSSGAPLSPNTLNPFSALVDRHDPRNRESVSGQSGAVNRRSRMEDLEDMMMLEAIRLSLAAEEERKKKEAKEAKKEAKKKEKADKKAEKAARKMYNAGGSNSASASGSALSLSLTSLGRRRGNSGNSSLIREAANTIDKGKGVERGNSSATAESNTAPAQIGSESNTTVHSSNHQLDSSNGTAYLSGPPLPSPIIIAPEKRSHLRQMSNASSPASSFMDSLPGSIHGGGFHASSSTVDSPTASGSRVGSITPDQDGDAGSAGTEPMFNFRSLAEMIDSNDSKDAEARHVEFLKAHLREEGKGFKDAEDTASNKREQSIMTLKANDHGRDITPGIADHSDGKATFLGEAPILPPPELMITPVTPALLGSNDDESKQLGVGMDFGMRHEHTTAQ